MPVLLAVQFTHHGVAFLDLFSRRAPVDRGCADARGNLLFQTADPLHEKFVNVVADDGEKLDAFQQGYLRVSGHVQHAAVELQPGQLTVEIQFGGIQIGVRRVPGRHFSGLAGFRFAPTGAGRIRCRGQTPERGGRFSWLSGILCGFFHGHALSLNIFPKYIRLK